jgi:predicted amidophosphoribosyltransferase
MRALFGSLGPRIGAVGRRLVDLAMPPACMACGRPVAATGALCAACWGRLRLIERPFCPRLAIPFGYDIGPDALSAEAIADPPPFARLRAVAVYDDVSGPIVQALKYHDHTELARSMGRMMARAAADLTGEADLVVPIPLHRGRLWRRRFNQSAMIAAEVARAIGRRHAPELIVRIKATRRQVGLKATERAANVQGAFRVPAEARPELAGRRGRRRLCADAGNDDDPRQGPDAAVGRDRAAGRRSVPGAVPGAGA